MIVSVEGRLENYETVNRKLSKIDSGQHSHSVHKCALHAPCLGKVACAQLESRRGNNFDEHMVARRPNEALNPETLQKSVGSCTT